MFLLTHRPLQPPDAEVTILSGDIGEAVAIALDAADGKNLEILAPTWPASAWSGGSSTRSWCMCCRSARRRHPLLVPGPCEDIPGNALSSTRSGDATILRFRVRKQSDQTDG
jgi:hypothetical protein